MKCKHAVAFIVSLGISMCTFAGNVQNEFHKNIKSRINTKIISETALPNDVHMANGSAIAKQTDFMLHSVGPEDAVGAITQTAHGNTVFILHKNLLAILVKRFFNSLKYRLIERNTD